VTGFVHCEIWIRTSEPEFFDCPFQRQP